MTVIAWDGQTLAADKRACNGGLARTVTKIYRVSDVLVGVAGDIAQAMEMIAWVRRGRKPDDFPASQRSDEWGTLVVIEADATVSVYEQSPYPFKIEDKIFASGSGRDFALAAMHHGKNAWEAVNTACCFDSGCGNGIDELRLEA